MFAKREHFKCVVPEINFQEKKKLLFASTEKRMLVVFVSVIDQREDEHEYVDTYKIP